VLAFEQVAGSRAAMFRKRWLGMVFVTAFLPGKGFSGLINNWVLHKILGDAGVSRLRTSPSEVDDSSGKALPASRGQAVISFASLQPAGRGHRSDAVQADDRLAGGGSLRWTGG